MFLKKSKEASGDRGTPGGRKADETGRAARPAGGRWSIAVAAALIAVSVLLSVLSVGCTKDDPTFADIEKKFDDVPGFDFTLPCPVADFFPALLFASNVPRDGIPSIDHPTFSDVSQASWLADDDRVLGVVLDGVAYAVPIRIMVWHEVLNISSASGKKAVTYCPLTFSGISFDLEAAFPGLNQSAGVSGLLYNSNLVLYDRKTDSFWTQMSGSAYAGPSAGECLDILPTLDTTLRFWKTLHPDTKILDRPGKSSSWGKYSINPYGTYWSIDDVVYPVPRPLDNRLSPKTWVLGVLADTGAKAYPIFDAPVVNDSLPGVPYVVFNKRSEKTLVAYKAWVVDGERLLFNFKERVGEMPTYTDDRTGSTWNFKGECIAGPLAGSVLERMPSYLVFYFAWWSYFPDTEIYVQ